MSRKLLIPEDNIIPTTFSNAGYAMVATDRTIVQIGTMSAPRDVALVAANSLQAGVEVTILDASGTIAGFNFITVTPNGTDTINGTTGSAAFIILHPYGAVALETDGTSKWTVKSYRETPLSVANGGTNQTTALAAYDALAPTSVRGDITYRGATTSLKLAKGTAGMFLKQGTNDPAWAALTAADVAKSYAAFGTDTTGTVLTNPTALTSLLNATFQVPASSVALGDVFDIEASGSYSNTQNSACTIEFQILFGSIIVFDWTTLGLTLNATPRRWILRLKVVVWAITSSGTVRVSGEGIISPPTAGTAGVAVGMSLGGGAAGDMGIAAGGQPSAIDWTAAPAIDLQTKISVSSSTAAVTLRHFRINKLSA